MFKFKNMGKVYLIIVFNNNSNDIELVKELLYDLCIGMYQIENAISFMSNESLSNLDKLIKSDVNFSNEFSFYLVETDKTAKMNIPNNIIKIDIIKGAESNSKKEKLDKFEKIDHNIKIDELLDKISALGIDSLTYEEQMFLRNNK